MQDYLLTCIVIIKIEVRAAASNPRLVAESVGLFNSDLSSKRTRKCHLSFCRPAAASRAKMPSVLVMLAMPIRRLIEEAFMPNSRSGSQGLDGSIVGKQIEPKLHSEVGSPDPHLRRPPPRHDRRRFRSNQIKVLKKVLFENNMSKHKYFIKKKNNQKC